MPSLLTYNLQLWTFRSFNVPKYSNIHLFKYDRKVLKNESYPLTHLPTYDRKVFRKPIPIVTKLYCFYLYKLLYYYIYYNIYNNIIIL